MFPAWATSAEAGEVDFAAFDREIGIVAVMTALGLYEARSGAMLPAGGASSPFGINCCFYHLGDQVSRSSH